MKKAIDSWFAYHILCFPFVWSYRFVGSDFPESDYKLHDWIARFPSLILNQALLFLAQVAGKVSPPAGMRVGFGPDGGDEGGKCQ